MKAITGNGRLPFRGAGIARLNIWAIMATMAGLTFTAGCGTKSDEAGTVAHGVTAPPSAAPAEIGTRRGNPDPNAAANAAAFEAARKKAEGK